MINVKDVIFSYNGTRTLDGVTLNIAAGEGFGIVGPNGSGKTTLIKLICRLLDAHSGVIKINDRPVEKYSRSELARLVAVVPQDAGFSFPFSVFEIVLMGRAPFLKAFGFETAHDVEVARRVMELTDTWQFRDRSILTLSGGERQRVIIARALAQEPQILLLDEPTTFLDLKHQSQIMSIVKNLVHEHCLTVVSVLHDINLAMLYCDRIALLKEGKVFAVGDAKDVMCRENIRAVFDTDVHVGWDSERGAQYCLPGSMSS